jgi:hypothetical protein
VCLGNVRPGGGEQVPADLEHDPLGVVKELRPVDQDRRLVGVADDDDTCAVWQRVVSESRRPYSRSVNR